MLRIEMPSKLHSLLLPEGRCMRGPLLLRFDALPRGPGSCTRRLNQQRMPLRRPMPRRADGMRSGMHEYHELPPLLQRQVLCAAMLRQHMLSINDDVQQRNLLSERPEQFERDLLPSRAN